MANRFMTEDQLAKLKVDLTTYTAGLEPFNVPVGDADSFNPKAWWRVVALSPNGRRLAALAEVLLAIVPHAAKPERTFSMAGWFQTKWRNRLAMDSVGKMLKIKRYWTNQRATCEVLLKLHYIAHSAHCHILVCSRDTK